MIPVVKSVINNTRLNYEVIEPNELKIEKQHHDNVFKKIPPSKSREENARETQKMKSELNKLNNTMKKTHNLNINSNIEKHMQVRMKALSKKIKTQEKKYKKY